MSEGYDRESEQQMLMSMTGYGRAQQSFDGRRITVEVKSVNNRYLDCNIKMPKAYIFAEDALKQRVKAKADRGKVDVFITVEELSGTDVKVSINRPLVEGYLAVFRMLEQEYGLESGVSALTLSRLPDVLVTTEAEPDLESLKAELCAVAEQALEEFNKMRCLEGEKLREDIVRQLDAMEIIVKSVEVRSPLTVEQYRQRLEQKLREVLQSSVVDEARIVTEAAIFADRVAINEELVRLRSHMEQMHRMLETDAPVGRKLDFLIQEMNREVNTIGSKGNDLEMSRHVVELKAELEKIREQVQNVE